MRKARSQTVLCTHPRWCCLHTRTFHIIPSGLGTATAVPNVTFAVAPLPIAEMPTSTDTQACSTPAARQLAGLFLVRQKTPRNFFKFSSFFGVKWVQGWLLPCRVVCAQCAAQQAFPSLLQTRMSLVVQHPLSAFAIRRNLLGDAYLCGSLSLALSPAGTKWHLR